MKNLTAIIVTFLRDEYLFLCVKSLREKYPDIKIIVGDQNPSVEKAEMFARQNVLYIKLPFDCGLCVARNKLVGMAQTDYVLIGDDDFQYSATDNVDKMLALLNERDDIDLIGGRIMEGGQVRNYQGYIEEFPGHFIYRALDLEREYEVAAGLRFVPVDLTFNFFVARKKAVEKTLWDEHIKVAYEHSTFFIDFKRAGFKTAFTPDAIVIHKPFIGNQEKRKVNDYKFFRNRKSDKRRFFEKFKLNYVIDMGGKKDVFDGTQIDGIDFLITHFERKEGLEKLLFSIAKYYPQANIHIADQSKKFIVDYYIKLWDRLFAAGIKNKPHAYNIPFDCGLSYARNYLVNITKSKYCLILEDDFVFTEKTRIDRMAEVLEANPEIGVIGGAVVEYGYELPFEHYFEQDGAVLRHRKAPDEWFDMGGWGYKLTGCVPNFAMMRRELFEGISWDEELKIEGEHTDFYLQMAMDRRFKVAYTRDASISHEKNNSKEYKEFRQRNEFLKKMFKKWEINEIIYLDGFTMKLEGDEIIKYNQKV